MEQDWQARAIAALGLEPLVRGVVGPDHPTVAPLAWLCVPRLQPTILAELGRIPDAAERRQAAVALCAIKPAPATALATIVQLRRAQLGQRVPREVHLRHALHRTIRAFRRQYPATTWAEVRTALAATDAVIAAVEPDASAILSP
jgi:hypothetical protein